MMQTLEYTVRFTTPAFLGNAEQRGQWRTPPFKALLRQWWRVVWAERNQFRCDALAEMRSDEGRLFGNAWLEDEFRKSEVRIRLSRWDVGKLGSWSTLERATTHHPEVGQKVGPHAYLGFGPLDGRDGTKFARKGNAAIEADKTAKGNAAIQAGETAKLSIAAPCAAIDDLRSALALIDAYGAAGGRSRNGWGSISLEPANESAAHTVNLAQWSRRWCDALRLDWPNAIGCDDTGPLVWRTAEPYCDWEALMRDLAIVKIGLRTMFVFANVRPPHANPDARHWLSYPITKHKVRSWGNARLPNSLRFKVRPDVEHSGKLRGVIFHMPCLPPRQFNPDMKAIVPVWQKSHQFLDELSQPVANRGYSMVADEDRRSALEAQLNGITLERISQ